MNRFAKLTCACGDIRHARNRKEEAVEGEQMSRSAIATQDPVVRKVPGDEIGKGCLNPSNRESGHNIL